MPGPVRAGPLCPVICSVLYSDCSARGCLTRREIPSDDIFWRGEKFSVYDGTPVVAWALQVRRQSATMLRVLLSVVVIFSSAEAQISFSRNSVSPDTESPPVSSSKLLPADSSVSFSRPGGAEKKGRISLAEILKKNLPAAPSLQTRFSFGSRGSQTGQACSTPLREPGSCNFITRDDA